MQVHTENTRTQFQLSEQEGEKDISFEIENRQMNLNVAAFVSTNISMARW